MRIKQGYEANMVFNCTYLETKITIHMYEK
jgi:hypothetical protein